MIGAQDQGDSFLSSASLMSMCCVLEVSTTSTDSLLLKVSVSQVSRKLKIVVRLPGQLNIERLTTNSPSNLQCP